MWLALLLVALEAAAVLIVALVALQAAADQAGDNPLAAHGEIGNGRKDESRVDNINLKGGTSQAYLLRRNCFRNAGRSFLVKVTT
jgi:hypothetical protein